MKNTDRPQRPRKDTKDKSFSPGAEKRSDKKSFSDEKRPYGEKKSPSVARPKGNFPKKDGFERSFSEPRFGEKRPFGAKKPFTNEPSESPFEKKAERGSDSKRPYGEKKSFSNDRPFSKREEGGFDKKRPYGEKKSFSGDSPSRSFEKRDGGSFEKRAYGDKKPFSNDRSDRPFSKREGGGLDKKRSYGDKKPFSSDRPERSFEKGEGGSFEKRSYGDKKPFSSDRPERSFEKREGGSFEKRSYGDKKPFSSDSPARSFEKRDSRSFEKRPYGDKKTFSNDRSDRPFDKREERGSGRGGKVERKENQASTSKTTAPTYNLDKMKSSLPARVQRKVAQEEKESDGLIRLNRYISNAGIASRRDADELIASGQITVNGKEITEMGYKVKPNDVVKYGKKILNREKLVYLLLNKPKDFITTTEDPNERKTVMDLVANACEERVYPVGRLDRNTTGLLLLTNDGELAEKLSHPSNEIKKIYQVELDKPITDEHFEAIKNGVELEDGLIKADDLGLVTPDAEVVGIEIHSGKNRIVRRIFEHFGYEVLKLDRTTYAGLNKKDLPRGKWRFLTEKEVIRLKYMI
ncbi:pseudouridine synthase [Emticicia sp. BO119]|uniref:pseudouridine synthase n=1 Tax=Emticicia sp. BO119 TaxID=2757768 RepID=UPI0015EFECAF|nr:pseudouridine synthase [Emticicia sp. BO119]MBA4850838.1 pseudouridine synthase [Emticicia sp. BO119]